MDSDLRFPKAVDVFEAFPTAREDMCSRPGNENSLDFFSLLVNTATPEEAITFGAYLLPRRKAVWWGHQCVTSLIQLQADPEQNRKLLQLAENWVREPEEGNRNMALQHGMAARPKSPGAWIALAAAWSGGSMASPTLPPVPPPPQLTAVAVNAGILGALARAASEDRAAWIRGFADMGIDLATR
jgi:hypothetical protein